MSLTGPRSLKIKDEVRVARVRTLNFALMQSRGEEKVSARHIRLLHESKSPRLDIFSRCETVKVNSAGN